MQGVNPNTLFKELFVGEHATSWRVFAGILAAIVVLSLIAAEGNMGTFSTTILNGMLRAMLLFLVAAGLSLIFGLMDVLNFAQGAFFMIGAYVAYDIQHPNNGQISFGESIADPNARFLLGIVVALIIAALLGAFLERVLLRPLYKRPLFQLVLTFGVSIIMLEGIKSVWSTTPYQWVNTLAVQDAQFDIFGRQFSLYRLFIIAMGFLLIIGISLLLRRTRIGIIIRAGVENAEMVSALGINVRAVFTLVFTIGCAIAAFGGAVAAPFLGATISMGNTYLLASIAVIVLGGLGSYEGTAVGSILIGMAWVMMEQLTVAYNIGTVWSSLTPMVMLALVLLLRPSGLFGEER